VSRIHALGREQHPTGHARMTENHGPALSPWFPSFVATVGGVFVHGDGDPVSFGCALGFINYL